MDTEFERVMAEATAALAPAEEVERYRYLMSLPKDPATRFPEARMDEALFSQKVGDECVLYDAFRQEAHTLNNTLGLVWEWSDGKTDVESMVERLVNELELSSH